MAQNFDSIRPLNYQEVVEDEGEGEGGVGLRPRGVLLAEIQDYKLQLAVRDKELDMQIEMHLKELVAKDKELAAKDKENERQREEIERLNARLDKDHDAVLSQNAMLMSQS